MRVCDFARLNCDSVPRITHGITTIDLVVVILCASVPDTGSDAYDTASDAYDTASDTRLMCMTHTVRCVLDVRQIHVRCA